MGLATKKPLTEFNLREAFWVSLEDMFGYCTASLPNGLKVINIFGNNVSTRTNAMNIANPVKRPKIIVGMKLDSANMEKPTITVSEV